MVIYEAEVEEVVKSSRFRNRVGFKRLDGQTSHATIIGSMIPFNGKLWIANVYASGIYTIDEDFSLSLEYDPSPSGIGNNFGRLYHSGTGKIILGHFIVDSKGNITELSPDNPGSGYASPVANWLADADRYALAGRGSDQIYQIDMENEEYSPFPSPPAPISWSGLDTLYRDEFLFATSASANADERGIWRYDGDSWTRVADEWYTTAYNQAPRAKWSPLYLFGWDKRSAILQWVPDTDGASLNKYRLPIAPPGLSYWKRMPWRARTTQGKQALANIAGIMYRLPYTINETEVPNGFRPKPICNHGWRIIDFTSWMGLLGIGRGENALASQKRVGTPNSGIDFLPEEELSQLGRLRGYGGVWKDTSVDAGETSDPFLINGFDKKTIHLETDGATDFTIQVDPIGDGSWKDYDTVSFSGSGYDTYIMTGDAIWVRVKSSDAVTATVWLNLG